MRNKKKIDVVNNDRIIVIFRLARLVGASKQLSKTRIVERFVRNIHIVIMKKKENKYI